MGNTWANYRETQTAGTETTSQHGLGLGLGEEELQLTVTPNSYYPENVLFQTDYFGSVV